MTDTPKLPPVQYADTNGIRMAYYEAGPADGVPVMLCHGFPELAYSWRHQIPALAAAGFRAIAPDQRGFGLTDRPDEAENYSIKDLCADLAGLLDALEIERCVIAGHDWGGIVSWMFPLLYPDRVMGAIGVNTPFMPRAPMDPIALMRATMGEDMYIVFFQKPGVADALLAKDVGKTFRFFMRKGGLTLAEYETLPAEAKTLALVQALQTDEASWRGEVLLNAEELAFFVDTFERTGFTGGINWYRNFTRNWQESEGLVQKIDVPALMIMAENDVVLRPSMADGMEQYVRDLERHLVKACGHWTQQEHPEETNRVMIDWLTRRFGAA